ncbi:MAG TPA: tautomerase family protein [Spirochaetota bacterium]|nr:tautomerase family protein [Spirochaetota bacterium]HOM38167.1 tautomerase family protein [Spirochaetota bacterium]HPQ48615.1 tautomerase family protein [Spirochaetota bacterium]
MPHIVIKMYPGRTEEKKRELAEKIINTAIEVLNVDRSAFSLSIEEIPQEKWIEVFKNEIINSKLYIKPGYNPLENNPC